MASSLTGVGIVWASLSLVAALSGCVAFYLPFWIQGRLLDRYDVYFGSFRRCNFPRLNSEGLVEIIEECGRYSSFWSIPTVWWKASTILVGMGCMLSSLVATTAAAACCISYVLHSGSAKLAGLLQMISVMLIFAGVAVYPAGWNAVEIKEACGQDAHNYHLGSCQLSWSAYLMASSIFTLLVCVTLSFKTSRIKPGSIRL